MRKTGGTGFALQPLVHKACPFVCSSPLLPPPRRAFEVPAIIAKVLVLELLVAITIDRGISLGACVWNAYEVSAWTLYVVPFIGCYFAGSPAVLRLL